MQSLINLIFSTLNNLILSFANMGVVSGLSLFSLLMFTLVIIAIVDVVRRLAQ